MTRNVDVVVVGAGPAGLSAAMELRKCGVHDVIVIERETEPGGIPRHCNHLGFGIRDLHRSLSGPCYAERLTKHALLLGVELQLATTVTSLEGDRVCITGTNGPDEVTARAVLIATGARERPRIARVVPGDRGAGVFTTGQLQQWVRAGIPIGHRALIVGAEHVAYSAVLTLRHAGVLVTGMITEHSKSQSWAAASAVAQLAWRVPLWTNSRIVDVHGRFRIDWVEVESMVSGTRRRLEVDTVVFTGDWIPDHELARSAGIPVDPGTLGPATDVDGRTDVSMVYAAGNLVHPVETADVAAMRARRVAQTVVSELGASKSVVNALVLEVERPLTSVWPNRVRTPLQRVTVRLGQDQPRSTLVYRQGNIVLGEVRLRKLRTGRSIGVDATPLRLADPARGVVRLSFG